MNKQAVVSMAQSYYRLAYEGKVPKQSACLQWADCVKRALNAHGIKSMIQAGTSAWRFVRKEDDDGMRCTHFSYEFHLDAAVMQLKRGILPEMHCWVGIPDRNEIVDITTGYQHEQCLSMLGERWHPSLALPDYLWIDVNECGDDTGVYRPNKQATLFAMMLLR